MAWEPGPSGLITLTPIYNYLSDLGYKPQHGAIEIEGWAVQFLPAVHPLVAEALNESGLVTIEDAQTRVFGQEYLMAICLDAGRPKDVARLVQFVQEGSPDETRLMDILSRHGLKTKFADFKRKFFPEAHNQ